MTDLTHSNFGGGPRAPSRPFVGQLPGRAQPSAGVTSQELLDGLLRRKGVILLAMLVGGLIAYHAAKTLPPCMASISRRLPIIGWR